LAKEDIKKHFSSQWLSSKSNTPQFLEKFEKKIALADVLSPQEVISTVLEKNIQGLLQKSNIFFEQELDAVAKIIEDPTQFLTAPINCLFNSLDSHRAKNKAVDLFEYQFNLSDQKSALIEQFKNYLNNFCDRASVLQDASLIIDELFTNAMYNAPDNDLENTRAGVRRDSQEFEMREKKFGKMFAGHRDSRLVIGCEDPFGTLNVKKLFEKIRSCLVLGADTMMSFGDGGAGIGGFLLFTTSVSLYVGVKRNQKTVICCVLPIGVGDHKRNLMPKNIHYFELEND
jgi:hypothetical protein